MPIIDGFLATKILRRIEEHYGLSTPVPIVAISANAVDTEKQKALESGMQDFLIKPINATKIKALLESYGFSSTQVK